MFGPQFCHMTLDRVVSYYELGGQEEAEVDHYVAYGATGAS
jgi:hypothetical protein